MKKLSEMVFLPAPRTLRDGEGAFIPRAGTPIILQCDPSSILPTAERLRDAILRAFGTECGIGAVAPDSKDDHGIRLGIETGREAQGYRLRIAPSHIEVLGSDPAGLFYGVTTLMQTLGQTDGALPSGEIDDRPDFPVRGVMLDVSRDKVPTMETLFSLIDMFAGLKLNHLQLYTEHTFAYAGHEEVWAEASPLTGEEVLRLDAYCRERFIELAPNQNSFGHMTRWLVHPRYRHLAECLEGFDWPWGGRSEEPFSLDPSDPGSVELLQDLFAQLLPHFSSRLFNVGCDETFDVGQGKNREQCARKGRGRVYLDFLLKIHSMVRSHGRTMLFWGDIIVEHPELVPELPRDAIALEWGYEADHPFAAHSERFAASGIPFWVCPGTSSWNSIAGRTDNCLANLRSAAVSGLARGATGYLVTDWGDNGHWQALPVSFLGFAAGAAYSWCLAANGERDIVPGLDAHVFHDRARIMGALARDLGNAYRRAGGKLHNASHLFNILRQPAGAALPESVTPRSLRDARALIEAAAEPLDRARMDRHDAALVRDELANTVRLLLAACDRGLGSAVGAGTAGEARTILAEYRRLWLARNRVGGLHESAGALAAALDIASI
jgi:hexosaminidase